MSQYYGRNIDDFEEDKNFFVNQRNKKFNDNGINVYNHYLYQRMTIIGKSKSVNGKAASELKNKVDSVNRPPIAPPSGGPR